MFFFEKHFSALDTRSPAIFQKAMPTVRWVVNSFSLCASSTAGLKAASSLIGPTGRIYWRPMPIAGLKSEK